MKKTPIFEELPQTKENQVLQFHEKSKYFVFFSAHIYNLEGKSSAERKHFYVYLLIEVSYVWLVLNLKIFDHQIIANLPFNATEVVRFLK